MKDWEVRKVNELYRRLDTLTKENERLKQDNSVKQFVDRLDAVEQMLVDVLAAVKPKRSTKK